ncbi:hypothetical protein [Oryzifoliimicrobium ureilyticus]|uniref:hypothetical protein n=1 Tax=Oryzifoliimicrobium ureilyticus TaxID=3113724 RepID=UPI00307684C4
MHFPSGRWALAPSSEPHFEALASVEARQAIVAGPARLASAALWARPLEERPAAKQEVE